MKTGLFIAIVLLSGCFAGTIYGALNLAIVEPYLDDAINIENQKMFTSGEADDTPKFWVEYYEYRSWQKGGEVLAGAILGTSIGALFGIVYALSKNSLPSRNNIALDSASANISITFCVTSYFFNCGSVKCLVIIFSNNSFINSFAVILHSKNIECIIV